MKKWIFSIISFVLSFVVLVVLVFEFSFRFLTAENVIHFMDRLGFRVSFDSWFVLLVLFSFLGALVVSGIVFYTLNNSSCLKAEGSKSPGA